MNLKNRIRKIERANSYNLDRWIESLSDEELHRISQERGGGGKFAEWLKTLTDDELETIRYQRRGADALQEKFYEFQKQNQKS